MYLDYWHLKEKPFENVMDFRFLYTSPSQEECLSRISYAVTEKKGGAVLVGPPGSGKTTLRELLIRAIKTGKKRRHFCSVIHPMMGIEEIIFECLDQLGVKDQPTMKPQLLRMLGNKLLQVAERGEETVLIIDDAHMIALDTLNELKLLMNLHDYNEKLLFTTILIGESDSPAHPGITSKLAKVPGLRQRLNIVVPMPALTKDELGHYIQKRLETAGVSRPLFSREAVDAIYRHSKGNPRETNNICDVALLIGYGEKLASVDGALVKRVLHDAAHKGRHEAH